MRKSTCSQCGGPRDRASSSTCRACHAAYMRARRPKYSELTEEQRRKNICRSLAHYYLKRGKIERRPCERCGSPNSQIHHADYSQPLEVTWLCRPCHLAMHRIVPKIPAPPPRFSRRRGPWRPPGQRISRPKTPRESEPYIPRGAIKRAQERGQTFIEAEEGIIVSGAFVRVL
jgi:hypothetical protein